MRRCGFDRRLLAAIVYACAFAGCAGKQYQTLNVVQETPRPPTLTTWPYEKDIDAIPAPPAGWTFGTPRVTNRSHQLVWISPGGHTAYGVIRFTLPFKVSQDFAFWGFTESMKKQDGRCEVIERTWDETREAIRFVVRGNRYQLHGILMVRGAGGWCSYAGSEIKESVEQPQFAQAEEARERTFYGPPEPDAAATLPASRPATLP